MKTVHFRNPTNRPSRRCRMRRLFIPLVLVGFGLTPMVQAVGPDTDGAIPGSNNGEGIGVLVSRTSGVWNTGTGFEALNHLTAGNQNTATGLRALFSNTSGSNNTANGVYALYSNTTGWYNSAVGVYALSNNTIGNYNMANGYQALQSNTTGANNTANGSKALYSNTTGHSNTANGFAALYRNLGSLNNTASGVDALGGNRSGNFNTANGVQALQSNLIGDGNTANGAAALVSNTSGSNNTALGLLAGNNVTTAGNVICIGANVVGANVSNSCFIGQIFGATSSGGTAVFINSDGKLGTSTSSRRFKEEIKPMERASEALFALKPVTFRYKKGVDPQGIPQFGLVAEEVEEVNPDLVVRDGEGKVNTVRYDAVNAMLLNEFLKEHGTIQELKSTVAEQRKEIRALTASLKEQVTQIRKVSAELAAASPSHGGLKVSKAGPRVVVNDP
jgi:hypothetical protein